MRGARARVRGGGVGVGWGGVGGGVNVHTLGQILFNVNAVGPNVNGVIVPGGVFVSVNVLNTLNTVRLVD